jgi:hypothetical protein
MCTTRVVIDNGSVCGHALIHIVKKCTGLKYIFCYKSFYATYVLIDTFCLNFTKFDVTSRIAHDVITFYVNYFKLQQKNANNDSSNFFDIFELGKVVT